MLAESMMAAVIIQTHTPGAPMFIAANFGMFDMRSGLNAMASPECCLLLGSLAEIAREFGLPSWGCAGATDSKCIDPQAAMESIFSILTQGMSGINLIHDVGYLDMGMTCSAEMLVMGNEAVGMAKRFAGGIEITDETMACDIIDTVGPGGNYLQQPHTMKHFKACWYPELATRSSYDVWENSGRKTMADRCREKTIKILETHQPVPLEESIAKAVRERRQKGEKEILGKA
jgi:trimethylamine--corrinoid protein Co-methyltransferase